MTRVILHIGTHKTGTTALQYFLGQNAAALHEQNASFPVFKRKYTHVARERNAHFLHLAAAQRAGTRDLTAREKELVAEHTVNFARRLGEFDTVILSEERIWHEAARSDAYRSALFDVLAKQGVHDVDVVVYLRRQDIYVESYWNQCVKSTGRLCATLSEYLRGGCPQLDYARGIAAFERLVEREHMTVRLYEQQHLAGGDVREDFLEALGLDRSAGFVFPDAGRRMKNLSLSGNLAEIKRIANLAPSYRERYVGELRVAAMNATAASPETTGASVMTREQRDELLAACAQGNAWVAQEYFGIESGELFATPADTRPVWEPDPSSLQRDTVLFFAETCAELAAHNKRLQKQVNALEARIAKLEQKRRPWKRTS